MRLGFHSGLFRPGFPIGMLKFFISCTRATFLAHLPPLDLVTLIIYGEEYKFLSSSLCKSPSSCTKQIIYFVFIYKRN
jgi:hypothetical protein